jgi:hypothetical protein
VLSVFSIKAADTMLPKATSNKEKEAAPTAEELGAGRDAGNSARRLKTEEVDGELTVGDYGGVTRAGDSVGDINVSAIDLAEAVHDLRDLVYKFIEHAK